MNSQSQPESITPEQQSQPETLPQKTQKQKKQPEPLPPKHQKHFACGIDNGFGNYKIKIENFPLKIIPSYLTYEQMKDDVVGQVKINGEEFTVGESAFRANQYSLSRNSDDASSKINDALKMLLGALAHIQAESPRKEWHLHLAASIHDSENFKDALINSLSGEHECILSGHETKVTVNVVKVLPEGMGALVNESLPKKLTVLDFGTGTTLLSRYTKGKCELHEPEPCGVEKLIELLRTEMKAINSGLPGDKHLIREALKSSLMYKTDKVISLEPIYDKCLHTWFNTYLKSIIKTAKAAQSQEDVVWCIGGGCLLPKLNPFLKELGFKIHKNPLEANVLGLFKLAEQLKGKVTK